MKLKTIVSERLIKLRKDNNLTQTDMAKKLGISQQAYQGYENTSIRTLPKLEDFVKIAGIFNVSYEYLLGETENKKKENINMAEELGFSDSTIEAIRFLKKDNTYYSDSYLLTELLDLYISGFDMPSNNTYYSLDTIFELIKGYIYIKKQNDLYGETFKEAVKSLSKKKDKDRDEFVAEYYADKLLYDSEERKSMILHKIEAYSSDFIDEAYKRFNDKIYASKLIDQIGTKIENNKHENFMLNAIKDKLLSTDNKEE